MITEEIDLDSIERRARNTMERAHSTVEDAPAVLALVGIVRAALSVEDTGRAYRESGWLSDENPLFKRHADAHRAFNVALSKVRR